MTDMRSNTPMKTSYSLEKRPFEDQHPLNFLIFENVKKSSFLCFTTPCSHSICISEFDRRGFFIKLFFYAVGLSDSRSRPVPPPPPNTGRLQILKGCHS